jgi:hypothetical protein
MYMDLLLFRGLNDVILQLFLRIKQLALSPTEIEPIVLKDKSPEKPTNFGNEGLNEFNSLIVDMKNSWIRNKQMEKKKREKEREEELKIEKEKIEKEKIEQRLEKLHGHIWFAKRLEAMANGYLLRLGLNKANLREEAKKEEEEMNRRVSMRRKTETLPIIRQFFRRVTRKVTELWRKFIGGKNRKYCKDYGVILGIMV